MSFLGSCLLTTQESTCEKTVTAPVDAGEEFAHLVGTLLYAAELIPNRGVEGLGVFDPRKMSRIPNKHDS